MKGYMKNERCHVCGKLFAEGRIEWNAPAYQGTATCTDERCNAGTYWDLNGGYKYPFEIPSEVAKKMRRQLEDRLRKDEAVLKDCLKTIYNL